MQAATDSPMPSQLEEWKEKHDRPIRAPFNNANVTKWRDEPTYIDRGADFDPSTLIQDKA